MLVGTAIDRSCFVGPVFDPSSLTLTRPARCSTVTSFDRRSSDKKTLQTTHRHDHSHARKADQPTGPLIFISACEQSADEHAASLIRATLAINPETRFVGIAGPRMVAAGCHRIFDMTRHAAMLLGALGAARQAIKMMSASDQCLRRFPFDAAVVVDSPTLHLPLVARAKAAGVPTLYFIAPQLWAWGAHRIHKIRNNVDRLACILPFEEQYFRNQGINAKFVGHPLADKLARETPNTSIAAELRALSFTVLTTTTSPSPRRVGGKGEGLLVALLPGSRKQVVREVLPGQLEIAHAISQAIPDVGFIVSVANPGIAPIIHSMLGAARVPIRVHDGPLGDLITACDLAIAASGTTTLEVAMHAKPMIVMYNASRLFYHLIARWMISTKQLSLPNILAGRELVPEFMPYYSSTEPIAKKAIELLRDASARIEMSEDLKSLTEPLRNGHASETTARWLLDLIERKKSRHH